MGLAGEDGVVDPQAQPDAAGGDGSSSNGSAASRDGDGGPFDPGLETGYLRRAPRDRPLTPELGAAPFDPGSGTGYDARRARKDAKQRRRDDRKREERLRQNQETSQRHGAFGQIEPTGGPATQAAAEAVPAPLPAPPKPNASTAPGSVTELRPRREGMAERLERERLEREHAERERRVLVERRRAKRERAVFEQRERRRRARVEKRRAERAETPRRRRAEPTRTRIDPAVQGPIKRRARAAENRRRAAARRRGLVWPTAKAGFAVSVVLALSAGLASVLGLPVAGLDPEAGQGSLANSAALFGVDPGTPVGLSRGYVFPIIGAHDFGGAIARFGAPRDGHMHEGQDIFAKSGRPEVAVHDGVVVDRGKVSDADDGGRGNYIAIFSPPEDRSFVYMHMLKPSPIQLGDQVHSGEAVGQVGCTGECDGPHLHFEVRIGKASRGADTKPVDPLPYLRQWPQTTPG